MDILGVRVDNLSKAEVLEKIRQFLDPRKSDFLRCDFHQIATVNQEFILEAQKNQEFKNILNACDLNIPDSFGLKLAFWKQGEKMKARIPGSDLVIDILKIAEEQGIGVFLAASNQGLSTWQETAGAIIKLFPKIEISGENLDKTQCHPAIFCLEKYAGSQAINEGSRIKSGMTIDYKILLCNFGAPQQEIFLAHQQGSAVRLAIGVGGSFDFLTEKITRAPLFWRKFGFEWLWRLILEPRYRFKRIFRALVVFPVKVLFSK